MSSIKAGIVNLTPVKHVPFRAKFNKKKPENLFNADKQKSTVKKKIKRINKVNKIKTENK